MRKFKAFEKWQNVSKTKCENLKVYTKNRRTKNENKKTYMITHMNNAMKIRDWSLSNWMLRKRSQKKDCTKNNDRE
jgi:ABC-type lipoprotein release transport system permease subunit